MFIEHLKYMRKRTDAVTAFYSVKANQHFKTILAHKYLVCVFCLDIFKILYSNSVGIKAMVTIKF